MTNNLIHDPILNYATYVDGIRAKFAIRIEIKEKGDTTIFNHDSVRHFLIHYLDSRLHKDDWCIQNSTGYNGRHYVWFMHTSDALAFALKFNGTVV